MVRGRTPAPEGLVLGHEITGEVVEVGPDVEFIKVGDLVSVPFNISCGRCRNCKEGKTGICLNVNPDRPGSAYKDARRIIAAAETKANEIGQPMNIAVVDSGGNLVAHVRQDGAWIGSVNISINKAWTSKAFDISTKDLSWCVMVWS